MLKTFLNSIYVYLIVAIISSALSGYFVFDWTSKYYTVKIEHANSQAIKEKDEIQRKGDQLVADYVKKIDRLGSTNTVLQKQIYSAVRPNSNDPCTVTSGFVRLYNASATGETSSPDSTDGTTSKVDAATLLSILIENNTKYNKVAQQLIELQAFENSK
jgi:hypothetical protein